MYREEGYPCSNKLKDINMRYLGSKARIVKEILPIILADRKEGHSKATEKLFIYEGQF